MRISTLVVVMGLLAGSALPVAGQAQDEDFPWRTLEVSDEEFRTPVADEMVGRIATAIGQLSSPMYKEREDAVKQLLTIGTPAFSQLRQAYARTDDLEVRLRVEDVVHEAYLDHHVFDRNAFLGISQERVPRSHDDDPRILERHYGVAVGKIIPNTAAQDYEMRKGDVIIALDGKPLATGAANLNLTFGESIRLRGPGALVTLSILRGEDQLELKVILGRRPKEYYARQGVVTDMLQTIDQNFGIWWVKHFRQPPPEN